MDIENWLKSPDRVLVLEQVPGTDPKSSTGLVDPRLFKGENNLHVIQSPEDQLWDFKYEKGGVPEDMKQRFTTFAKAKDFAEQYYGKRNIRIKSVIE